MKKIIALFARALPYLKSVGSWFITVEGGPLGWFLGIFDALMNSQTGRLFLVGMAVFVGTWFWCWTSEHSKIAAAVQARDAYYLQQISKVNAAAEKRILEANDAARKVTATPPAGPELLRLCLNSPDCRKARK